MESTIFYCDGCGMPNDKKYERHFDQDLCPTCINKIGHYISKIRPYNGYVVENLFEKVKGNFWIGKDDNNRRMVAKILEILKYNKDQPIKDEDLPSEFFYEKNIVTKDFLRYILIELAKIF